MEGEQQSAAVIPDNYTYRFVLKACAYLFSLSEGKQVNAHVLKLGFESDTHICNSLIHFYATCGFLDLAHKVFEKMSERSEVSWNVMIDSYASAGLWFLSKATGTTVDWVQMPGMKPGPDSVGIFAISQSCSGVAARACGLVSLEPTKIAEILKDRPSWFRECRSLEVFTMFPAGNGGTIELVYTQTYAPTTLAPARDFWTLRYTTSLENGNLVVCERSLSGSGSGPNAVAAAQFVRAEMLPSGYLIRPCEGGGSIIHIVDHLNLEACSVPEVLRPLYESSKVVAQKMTIAALRYIRQIAQETSGEVVYGLGQQPAVLRTFSQRLSRGFNDAVNGFNDDGWTVLNCDGAEDVIIAVNSTKNLSGTSNPASSLTFLGGILCAKASMLLQNVPPAVLVRFLREHRSEWADFNVDAYAAASLKAGSYAYPGMRPTRFTGSQIIMPLGHTIEHEEMLEVIRLEGHSLARKKPADSTVDLRAIAEKRHSFKICVGSYRTYYLMDQISMSQGENVSTDLSIWLKEKWNPGEIPEEAPPDSVVR
ncbi:homeobox-leucine zipper protein REVOLUTA-like [Arachis stenosperma]|uniref:homeobox-leucine zipper protein REVOLUTA-like n=1 Tax=Arachis stenosperma TaxID=217475 RepID=UPI0025AD2E26|nr:homeobox-leucine zipper protein REVOLUTA-like [Arachis stenosperma]